LRIVSNQETSWTPPVRIDQYEATSTWTNSGNDGAGALVFPRNSNFAEGRVSSHILMPPSRSKGSSMLNPHHATPRIPSSVILEVNCFCSEPEEISPARVAVRVPVTVGMVPKMPPIVPPMAAVQLVFDPEIPLTSLSKAGVRRGFIILTSASFS